MTTSVPDELGECCDPLEADLGPVGGLAPDLGEPGGKLSATDMRAAMGDGPFCGCCGCPAGGACPACWAEAAAAEAAADAVLGPWAGPCGGEVVRPLNGELATGTPAG